MAPPERLFGSLLLAALLLVFPAPGEAWDSRRLATPLLFDGEAIPYAVFAVYLMPGENFEVRFKGSNEGGRIEFLGSVQATADGKRQAPVEPGLYPLTISHGPSGESATLNVFVMTPATALDSDGRLRGYRIGRYPEKPLRGQRIYLPPPGFIELTESNADAALSPNFTLGQFASKQSRGFPKYLVLRSSLLLKLENILANINAAGRPTEGLFVMSGYRTPFYNAAIGNVPYSRHVWGGAADLFIDDAPRDGKMDDLDGNGIIDKNDARWLADFINDLSHRGAFGPRIGGLGVYGSNAAHGPFVHVDVRGHRARW